MSAEVAERIEQEQTPVIHNESAALISIISRAASDPAVDIDKMERLLQMQERILERNARMAFASALADMQAELPVINERGRIEVRKKDASGERTGAVQQSTSYALWEDINEAIRPFLQQYGFALSFRTGQSSDGRVTVTGILSHREGHREETTMTLQHDSTGSKNAVQAIGSSTSYGKRYTAMALLNITSRGEDDDGGKAGEPETINLEQLEVLQALVEETSSDIARFCIHMGVQSLAELPAARFGDAKRLLEGKRARK